MHRPHTTTAPGLAPPKREGRREKRHVYSSRKMHRGAIAPYWTITHWICHGCSGREGASSRAIARPDAPSRPRPAAPGLARADGRASCLPPTLASRPAHPAPALRRPPLPGQQILSDADASLPGIAGPRLPSPGLAWTRPAPPGPARPRPGWRTRVLPAPDIGILTRTLPQAAPSPGRTPPVRPQDNPGTRTPGLRPASPGLARAHLHSPGLADARPACPRHRHRDP